MEDADLLGSDQLLGGGQLGPISYLTFSTPPKVPCPRFPYGNREQRSSWAEFSLPPPLCWFVGLNQALF